MKHTMLLFLTVAAFLCSLPFSAQAAVVFYDDFVDEGTYDQTWREFPQNAWDWNASIADSKLTVRDFNTWVSNVTFDDTWALITLFHDFDTALSDFNVEFQFAWSSDDPSSAEQSVKAMQRMYVQIYDDDGVQIARAGYSDSWVTAHGGQHAKINGGEEIDANQNSLGASGSAAINISRTGDELVLAWDGEQLVSGTNNKPLKTIGVLVYYYPYAGAGGPSFFGTESVDLVRVKDKPGSDTTTSTSTAASTSTTSIPCPTGFIDCGDGLCCPPLQPQCCETNCCRADEMCLNGVCSLPPPCISSTIYGEHSEEVALLRKYRDEVLRRSPLGQEIIGLYYLWSPVIVRAMEEDEEFKQEVQALIEQLLPMIESMVQ